LELADRPDRFEPAVANYQSENCTADEQATTDFNRDLTKGASDFYLRFVNVANCRLFLAISRGLNPPSESAASAHRLKQFFIQRVPMRRTAPELVGDLASIFHSAF
jgi:hypothetical protein